MRAIISCVHANEEALRAVLEDIARYPVEGVYCLGDTLGYGPSPVECLDVVMRMPVVLLGNHDAAVLHEPDGFCASAEKAVFYHQSQLTSAGEQYTAYLAGLRNDHTEGDTLFVHGSARHRQNEYVFPEDVYNEPKMSRIGDHIRRTCFCGHTHIPGVFTEVAQGRWEYQSPDDIGREYVFDGRKTIVNVGSVGQPRDSDPRACYVLHDGDRVRFRRVAYDVDAVVRKVRATPNLDNFIGDRLREGR